MSLGRNKKVLLVDYEVSKMKATEDFLTQAGFEVVKAFDGLDALEKFAEEQPDLVLLSAMLPKLHGFEVCKAIKQSDVGKTTPVLITTSVYKSYKYKRQAMKDYMADDYILKPFNYEELLVKIREHLGISETEESPAAPKAEKPAAKKETPKPSTEQKQKEAGRSFDKLLDETLETLLRTSEMEEIAEESKPDKPSSERDLDSILEDTLSGLLKVTPKSTHVPSKTKPKEEKPKPPKPTEEKRKVEEKSPVEEKIAEQEPVKEEAPVEEEFAAKEEPEREVSEQAEESTEEVSEIDRIIDEAITIIDESEA
ncbi:response regulator transcription factor, partial [bacterium]|nr:response regulator transcription factor [candidate division CSSED10-310 bacterium]